MENDYILKKLEQDCFRDISKYIYIYIFYPPLALCESETWNWMMFIANRYSMINLNFTIIIILYLITILSNSFVSSHHHLEIQRYLIYISI